MMQRSEESRASPALAARDFRRRSSPHHFRSIIVTALTVVLVWMALNLPGSLRNVELATFLRLPLLGIALLALMVAIRPRASRTRTAVAATVGGALGAMSILRLLDMGFREALGRKFSPVVDWVNVGSGVSLLVEALGRPAGIALIGLAVLLVLAILVAIPLATLRVARAVARSRRTSGWVTIALATGWVGLAMGNVHIDDMPVASTDATQYAHQQVLDIPQGIRDQRTFAAAAAQDSLRSVPDDELLTTLRDKDVLFVFVESYGRVALEDPGISGGILELLDAEGARLGAAGFSSRSAYLTSPTFGGISWLAHATFQSGLWADSKPRYDVLVASDRLTLSHAFKRAGWRTVVDVPANTADWDQQSFYDYDQVYDSRNVDYQGPRFGYPTIPDQYTLEALQRLELAEAVRPPVMAEIDLISSHAPWTPLPQLVDQDAVGDGSVYENMPREAGPSDSAARRAQYAESIKYSLASVFSFMHSHADDDTVLVFLGDHQPSTIISGSESGNDVPISIIARDPAVIAQTSSWGWDDGLVPSSNAPVTRMDAFRDEFLAAFNS